MVRIAGYAALQSSGCSTTPVASRSRPPASPPTSCGCAPSRRTPSSGTPSRRPSTRLFPQTITPASTQYSGLVSGVLLDTIAWHAQPLWRCVMQSQHTPPTSCGCAPSRRTPSSGTPSHPPSALLPTP